MRYNLGLADFDNEFTDQTSQKLRQKNYSADKVLLYTSLVKPKIQIQNAEVQITS